MKALIAYGLVSAFGAVIAPVVFGHMKPRILRRNPGWATPTFAVAGALTMCLILSAILIVTGNLPDSLLPDPSNFDHDDGT